MDGGRYDQRYEPNYEFQQRYAQISQAQNYNKMSPSDYNDDPVETYDDMDEGNAHRTKYQFNNIYS